MPVISFTACSGAPGTTTLVQALAGCWPRPCVLVEADPDGGRLAARCGLPARPGLVDLAAVARSGRVAPGDLRRVAQRSADGVDVLVAHPDPDQTRGVLRSSAARIGDALGALDGVDALVDVGRLRPDSEALPLVTVSALTVVVAGTRLEDIAAMVHRRRLLDQFASCNEVGLVVTASGEHVAEELAAAVRLRLIGVRPGRSVRRSSERARRRAAQWTRGLALDLAARVTDSGPLATHLEATCDVSRSPFALPTGPPLPGPVPVPEITP